MKTLTRGLSVFRTCHASGCNISKRCFHQTISQRAVTNLTMPSMSPTMTEGGISSWKKREGEAFVAGDVILEIETDKATIDVEAQDDGVLGKILLPDGTRNIPIGKVIALLAEEGDDISNLQPPTEDSPPKQADSSPTPPSSTPAKSAAPPQPPSPSTSPSPPQHPAATPKHSRPLFPSVHRLLLENNVSKPEEINGTGVRGMLTKGDVLAYLGKASGPLGTLKESSATKAKPASKKEEVKPLDGPAIRRLIVSTMLENSLRTRNAVTVPLTPPDFDSIIADYLPSQPPPLSAETPATSATPLKSKDATALYFEGLF